MSFALFLIGLLVLVGGIACKGEREKRHGQDG
jgi:hypothetical protein